MSKGDSEQRKQKALEETYRRGWQKREALLQLKNLYLSIGIAEWQIKNNKLFSEKDTMELVVLRRHHLVIGIENQLLSLKMNKDFIITDEDIIKVKQESKDELKDPIKYIKFEILE